ncbi:DUF5053 domain-containing protein [Parabacteroides timonensis]|uniref:DUF5053 domain-containing protein n=1 Tax=Parabacteroides timonensis TaxID=1871013 RepID=UPI00094E3CE8|nr:DUF5053 domain-containing protein [Parabacteroides timonensis]
MDKETRFFELKELWKQSSEAHRTVIDKQISELLDGMTEEELEQLTTGVQKDFDNIHREAVDIKEQLAIREKLEPVLPYLSISKLSKDYFGKSSSWFYQRLNGNKIHGRICRFTDDELSTLDMALRDISKRISSLQLI